MTRSKLKRNESNLKIKVKYTDVMHKTVLSFFYKEKSNRNLLRREKIKNAFFKKLSKGKITAIEQILITVLITLKAAAGCQIQSSFSSTSSLRRMPFINR